MALDDYLRNDPVVDSLTIYQIPRTAEDADAARARLAGTSPGSAILSEDKRNPIERFFQRASRSAGENLKTMYKTGIEEPIINPLSKAASKMSSGASEIGSVLSGTYIQQPKQEVVAQPVLAKQGSVASAVLSGEQPTAQPAQPAAQQQPVAQETQAEKFRKEFESNYLAGKGTGKIGTDRQSTLYRLALSENIPEKDASWTAKTLSDYVERYGSLPASNDGTVSGMVAEAERDREALKAAGDSVSKAGGKLDIWDVAKARTALASAINRATGSVPADAEVALKSVNDISPEKAAQFASVARLKDMYTEKLGTSDPTKLDEMTTRAAEKMGNISERRGIAAIQSKALDLAIKDALSNEKSGLSGYGVMTLDKLYRGIEDSKGKSFSPSAFKAMADSEIAAIKANKELGEAEKEAAEAKVREENEKLSVKYGFREAKVAGEVARDRLSVERLEDFAQRKAASDKARKDMTEAAKTLPGSSELMFLVKSYKDNFGKKGFDQVMAESLKSLNARYYSANKSLGTAENAFNVLLGFQNIIDDASEKLN